MPKHSRHTGAGAAWLGRPGVSTGGRFVGNLRWGPEGSHNQYRPNWMQRGLDEGLDLEESIMKWGGSVFPEHSSVGPVELHSVVDAVEDCHPYGDGWTWEAFAEEWHPAPDEEAIRLRMLYESACAANGITPLRMYDRRPWRVRQAELDQNSGAVVDALARLAAAEVTRG